MSKRQHGGSGPVPARWLNCPNKSDGIIAEKFVAFKTPLSEKFDSQVQGHFFSPSMLFEYMKTYHKVSASAIFIFAHVSKLSRFRNYEKNRIAEKNRIVDRPNKHFEIL